MHQNLFRLGLRPRPRWGAYSTSPDPLAVFKGPTSKGKEGEAKRGGKREGEGRGRETEGGDGQNDLTHPLSQIPGYATEITSRNVLRNSDLMICSLTRLIHAVHIQCMFE